MKKTCRLTLEIEADDTFGGMSVHSLATLAEQNIRNFLVQLRDPGITGSYVKIDILEEGDESLLRGLKVG